MGNKIKKYVKFIFCGLLIAGLISPSYAALSASDGSAFVTKAEFDSSLADFNSRLTTFEAGINSKIDSQVTSYLDRNGIWNGRAQLINAKWNTDWLQGITIIGDNNPDVQLTTQKHVVAKGISGKLNQSVQLVNHYADASPFNSYLLGNWHEAGIWSGGNRETGDVENYEDRVVENFDKSGMCAIDYEFRSGVCGNIGNHGGTYTGLPQLIWWSSSAANRNTIFHTSKCVDDNVLYLTRFSADGTTVNNGRSGIVVQTGMTMTVKGDNVSTLVNTFDFVRLTGQQMREKSAWQEGDEIWEYFVVPQDDVVFSGTIYFFVSKGQRLTVDRIATAKVSRQPTKEILGTHDRGCLMTVCRFDNCRIY